MYYFASGRNLNTVPTSPPATATHQLADWLATQLQTGVFHIGIDLDIVYILHVSLARLLACILTWLHHQSFCPLFIFICNPNSNPMEDTMGYPHAYYAHKGLILSPACQ